MDYNKTEHLEILATRTVSLEERAKLYDMTVEKLQHILGEPEDRPGILPAEIVKTPAGMFFRVQYQMPDSGNIVTRVFDKMEPEQLKRAGIEI